MAKIGQVKWVETSILHGDLSFFANLFVWRFPWWMGYDIFANMLSPVYPGYFPHGSQSKRGDLAMNCLVDLCPSRWWCWNDHSLTVYGINRCDVWNPVEKRGILHVNWCRMSSICCDVLWFRSPEISTVLPWKDERVTSNVDPGFPRGTANKLAITGSWFLEQSFPYIIYI